MTRHQQHLQDQAKAAVLSIDDMLARLGDRKARVRASVQRWQQRQRKQRRPK